MSGGETAFLDAQLPRVRSYVAEVCDLELADEAVSAASVDFRGRAADASGERELGRLLLEATRSAAASRFAVAVPPGRPGLTLTAECRTMPELLALHANREPSADERMIAGHLASCAICAHTLERMRRAERAFASAAHGLPEIEVEVTTVDVTQAPPQPRPEDEPLRESAPPAATGSPGPQTMGGRHRSGGVVGAIRKLGRTERG